MEKQLIFNLMISSSLELQKDELSEPNGMQFD